GQAPASPHRQRARAAAGGRGGDRTQLGSRSRAPGRSRHGAERRGSRDGGPAMDPVLLLARLSLPDGRPHAARAGLPAAQARDRELPRLRGARRGRALASAAHGVAELATVPDANYDLALLTWGLETLIASAEYLRLDEPLLDRWRDVLANLTSFPTDSSGLMVGRGRPWKESLRHYSRLLAIYPLHLI